MKRALVLLVSVCAAAAQANTFNYLPFRMTSSAQQPFGWYIDNRQSTPAGLDVGLVKNEAEAAWSKWNALTCALPKTAYRGFTASTVPNPTDIYDNFNVMPVWVTQQDQTYSDTVGGYVAALTIPVSYAGVLVSCDTFMNAVNFQWSMAFPTTPAGTIDVQTTFLHEYGHCLGLDHFGGETDIMIRNVTQGENLRTLGPNDQQALCERNPVSGGQFSPCSADGGCGSSSLKCITQTLATETKRFCSQGCTVNSGSPECSVPLACQTSAQFPGLNGACLLPSGTITPVGKDCANAGDCDSPQATCIQPQGNSWANGYCTQSCGAGRGPCPVGSACTQFDDGSVQCMKSCRVGSADCRAEYACQQTTNGGVCIPRCYTDNDCGTSGNFTCRTCDGLCVNKQTPTAQIGEVCTADAQCGSGQVCVALDPKSSVKLCTEQCGRGCAACRPGSSCHAMNNGDLFCLRDCTGPNSCPAGTQCSDVSGGKGCMPPCASNPDCPVGLVCLTNGQCGLPEQQMCGALCPTNDGGGIIVPKPKDAGTGGGTGIGGCGCAAADGSSMLWLLAAAALFVVRNMKWHQP